MDQLKAQALSCFLPRQVVDLLRLFPLTFSSRGTPVIIEVVLSGRFR